MTIKYGYSQKDYNKKKEKVENLSSLYNEEIEEMQIQVDKSKMEKLEKEIDFYQRHPFLTPFVGKEYEKAKVKILVVMESHYLPVDSRFYDEYDKDNNVWLKQWYGKEADYTWDNLKKGVFPLTKEDIKYIWTERVVRENIVSNPYFQNLFMKFLKPIYDNVVKKNEKEGTEREILETVNHIAFMNYFLRPAETTGRGIHVKRIDKEKSYENLNNVYTCLQPDLIVICSNSAGTALNKSIKKDTEHLLEENTHYIRLYHPSNQSWGRKWKVNEEEWTSETLLIHKVKEKVGEKENEKSRN